MPPTRVVLACLLLCSYALPARAEDTPPADPVERALTSPQATGLLVTHVVPESQASAAGVVPSDVISAYAGQAVPTVDALRAAMQSATTESVELTVVHVDGAEEKLTIKPGPIGVQLAPVVKGKGVDPLPPATGVKFDFSSLADAPHDDWYDFTLGGEHAGFEHGLSKLEDGKLVMRREVAFDGGEQWGVNHFDVTVVLTAESTPRVVSFTFLNPVTGYAGSGVLQKAVEGHEILRYTHSGNAGGPTDVDFVVPVDLPVIPSYAVETLACFMPREKGACFHYRSITDGSGEIGRPAALLVMDEEVLVIGGSDVKTVKMQVHTFGGGASTAFWVNEQSRVVKADYMGAVATAAPQAECLEDLHHGLVPRTASSD